MKIFTIIFVTKQIWWIKTYSVLYVVLLDIIIIIFECVAVKSKECIHFFNVRIHIMKIMSIIIIV